MKLKFSILLILLLPFSVMVHAQKSCLNTLREAKDLYDQGLIDEIPDLLADCMETGFTRAQRIEAYKLIILAYLFDDDQFAAEKMMDEFLKKFPEYEIMPNDPVEFVYLLESYKTSSVYSLNLFLGPTFSNRAIIEPHSTMNVTDTRFVDKTGTGFQMGFGVSRNLFKSVNGSLAIIYSVNNYSYGEITTSLINSGLELTELRGEERLEMIRVPLYFSYSFGKGNLNYVGHLGASAGYLNKAELRLYRQHPDIDEITSSGENIRDRRNKYYFSGIFGVGIEYKVPRGLLFIDLRAHAGFQDMVRGHNVNNRFLHQDYHYRLNSLCLSFGYHFSIYTSKRNRF